MKSTDKLIIHQGNSVITTEILPDYSQPVVVKKPSKQDSSSWNFHSIEREYEMTRSLDSVEGVRKALGKQRIEGQQVIILEYIDGETLHDHISGNKLDIRSRLETAIDLARILGKIHKQKIIHLDINSNNILIDKQSRALTLIDLGSASFIDRYVNLIVQPDQILGSLSYISPEQTGRINRPLDERSDLYSMGVVLYELISGQLPFDSKDPMEIVHQHIASIPDSPSELRSEIPEVLSAIILKLLSKNAEERYQSAAGVQADLEKCLSKLSADNTIEEFPLGETDYATRLRFPKKLYGREHDLKELERAFESVFRDSASILFIGGYSGVGKTSLVEEIKRPVSEKSGYFIEGKFDQLVSTPYAGISQALAQFISQILAQTETRLAAWRSKILKAVGPNGRVLIDIVPSLELVIGPQPAVQELSGQEAQSRLYYVFQRFFDTIAHSDHPVCLFLDDLQWVDPGSLGLLMALFTSPDLAHLLVVGAYRDNEVDKAHPLMTLIADLEKTGAKLKRMTLLKLAKADFETLISDVLRRDPGEISELSRLIYKQTDGNPFFTRQVLNSMENQDLLTLDTAKGHWRWDMHALRDLDVTVSVVELLVGKLKELPADTLETIKVAACIGRQFDIATLTLVREIDKETILDHVQDAIAAGMIWERDDLGFFIHDHIQEAAYALVPIEERDRLHLRIGQLLLQRPRTSDDEQDLYQLVDQLNHGLHLLEDEQERMQIARLNLQAGRKAKHSSAFSSSAEYLKQSASLLAEEAWREQYPMMLDVHNEWIEVCYLSGQFSEMEVLFNKILVHGKQAVDLRIAFRTMIQMKIGIYEFNAAISLADEYLERLQISFDSSLDSRLSIDELYNLPVMKDKEKKAVIEILEKIINPMGFVASERFTPLIYTLLNTISNYGNCDVSSSVVTWYGTLLSAQGKYQEGYEYGQLGVKLLDKFPSQNMASANINMQSAWIQPWISPIHDLIAPLKEAGYAAIKQGVFENGCYNFINRLILMWGIGSPLSVYLSEAEECIRLCQRTNQEATRIVTAIFTQAALNLSEKSELATKLEGKWFSEKRMLQILEGNALFLGFYRLLKITLSYLFGDSFEAYGHIEEALNSRRTLLFSHYYVFSKISFYGALSCIDRLSNVDNDIESREMLERLELFEEELRLWAQSAPMNFQHEYDLVMAEKSRIKKENWKAIHLYEAAIKGAKENRFVHEEALANELYASFWKNCGNDRIAEVYMREAHGLYHQWGADAKVDHLEKSYPQWFQTESIPGSKPDVPDGAGKVQTSSTQAITPIQLDMESIISASQMLSAETDFEQLLNRMIALVMANSGAEKAVLLLRLENDWFVQARGDSSSEKYDILLNLPLDLTDRETDFIPESVFNYCRRSKEMLVVGNAKLDQRFSQDRTIQKHQVLSLACFPVLNQGELKAMLYLENCQLADVFSLERQQVMRHLSTQFGISVENALLYDGLNSKRRELAVSETRFRSLVENANETIVVSQDDLVKYANEKVEELSGYSLEEIKELGFRKFIHPDDLNTVLSEYQARLSGEKPASKYSIRIISKQGQTKYVYITSARIDWDGRPATLALITDITQLKKVESELRISKERYELAVAGSDAGIWDYNISTGNIYYSDRFKELLGYEPHEMNDHTPEQSWDNLHPDFREIAPLKLDQHLKKETPYYHIDYLMKTKSGEYRWFQARGKAVWDENGNPIKIAGSFIDIHDRKNAEEKIRQTYDEIKVLKDQLQAESEYLQQEIKLEHNFESIIGQSEALKYVLSRVEKVAPTDFPALIMGETGTGKELIARVIHQLSPRGKRAMVKVNCAALPAELIESELFGREKGAFTGAATAQAGRFELASGSTLFLDEIGELPLKLQAKLLRVLESGEFERLGSSRTLHSDARIIAATNRELEEEVHKGHFRDDLWYRIKVFPITVPPLRERSEDIPLLVQSFLDELCRKMGKPLPKISSRDMQLLQKYPWPGNIRELRHSIETAFINAEGNKLSFELPEIAYSEQTGFKSFEEMERDYILRVLKAKQWRIGGANGAASALALNVNTLRGKMTKLGIKKPPS